MPEPWLMHPIVPGDIFGASGRSGGVSCAP